MSSSADLMTQTDIQAAIYEHARAWFPKECCGLLVSGPAGSRAVLAENLQDRYHALDPETYPRTAEKAYLLDPRLVANVEAEGDTLVAIVHSHCRVGAYFSDEDKRQALAPSNTPWFPDVEYVVLDAHSDGVKGFKVFQWSEDGEDFVQR